MAARTALSSLKGRLPTIGTVCPCFTGANIAAESSRRCRIKPVAQFISKRVTVTLTEVDKTIRTGLCFNSREDLDMWRINAKYKFGKPDAGNAYVKHSVLENLTKKEVNVTINDKRIFYAMCYQNRPSKTWVTVLSLDDDGKVLPKYDILPPYPLHTYLYSSICNGVFCYEDAEEQHTFHLWNPATNQVKTLNKASAGAYILSRNLWFDDKSQDYKVMRFIQHDDKGDLEIDLYSLKSDSWKKISCAEFCDSSVWLNVFINGVFYTIAYRKEGSSEEVILKFDISTETISYLPLHGIFEKKALYLLDYNGLLSVLSYVPDGTDNTDYEHWVMSNGSWLKLSVFHTRNVGRALCFSRNGELLFFKSLNDHELRVFDSATGKLKHLKDCGPHILDLSPFSESFVKLDGVSEVEFTSGIISMRGTIRWT